MSSRSTKREMLAKAMDDALDDGTPATGQSLREIDAGIFGAAGAYNTLDLPEVEHLSASSMPISSIFPHPSQPRRVLPTDIRRIWNGDPTQLGDVFDKWVAQVEEERGGSFDVLNYLNQSALPEEFDANDDHAETPGPRETSLLHLLELAVSIKNQGLMNPITIAAQATVQGRQYMVETGERRWFAYHLLAYYTGDKKYTTIPARLVPQVDVWRQATENTARQNLNAIGRARQLAILIMDLLKSDKTALFAPMSEYVRSHEQNYYAQVSEGKDTRIPRNSADKLLAATGFKTKEQLRNHRALLRLPVRVWELADDLNWPERFIRDLVREAHGDEDKLIQKALKAAEDQGYIVSMGTLSPDGSKNRKRKQAPKNTGPNSAVYYAEFVKLLSKAGPGKEAESHAALERLTELRRFLDEQEHQLRRFLSPKSKL